MLQTFNDAPNSLGPQSDRRQRGNFFGAHSLPEVEPENHAVTFLVGPGQGPLQVLIDLVQKDFKSDLFLASLNLISQLRIHIAGGNMRFAASRCLTVTMLEMVMRGVSGSFLQISQYRVGVKYGKVPEEAAAVFP